MPLSGNTDRFWVLMLGSTPTSMLIMSPAARPLLTFASLQYQNRKAEYFGAIWDVINWKAAEKRFK